jgi:hypothetical protein
MPQGSEATTAMKEISPVSMIMVMLRPSTPMKYSMLKAEIQTVWCTNWMSVLV